MLRVRGISFRLIILYFDIYLIFFFNFFNPYWNITLYHMVKSSLCLLTLRFWIKTEVWRDFLTLCTSHHDLEPNAHLCRIKHFVPISVVFWKTTYVQKVKCNLDFFTRLHILSANKGIHSLCISVILIILSSPWLLYLKKQLSSFKAKEHCNPAIELPAFQGCG